MPELSCEESVASVAPTPSLAGYEDLPVVSPELAETTDACDSLAEWRDALTLHPEVIPLSVVTDEDIQLLIYGSCVTVVRDQQRNNAVCDDARELYHFDFTAS